MTKHRPPQVNVENARNYFTHGGNFVIWVGAIPVAVVARSGSTATLRDMLGNKRWIGGITGVITEFNKHLSDNGRKPLSFSEGKHKYAYIAKDFPVAVIYNLEERGQGHQYRNLLQKRFIFCENKPFDECVSAIDAAIGTEEHQPTRLSVTPHAVPAKLVMDITW